MRIIQNKKDRIPHVHKGHFMSKHFLGVLATAGFAAAAIAYSSQSSAHHAFAAEFDINKPLQVQGTVTRARFVNPHGWLYLDVQNADGTKTNWGFEFGSPGALRSRGLTREDVGFGKTVRISGYRSKNTGPFGYAQTVRLADGREFQVGGAPDAPAARGGQ